MTSGSRRNEKNKERAWRESENKHKLKLISSSRGNYNLWFFGWTHWPQPYLISDFLPRLEETENTTENYRARTAELRRDILENKTEKERTENSLESARDTLNQVRAAREEAEELWREKYLLNQSERLEERNRVKDLLAQVRALLSYQTISHLYQVISVKAAARCRTSKSAECF